MDRLLRRAAAIDAVVLTIVVASVLIVQEVYPAIRARAAIPALAEVVRAARADFAEHPPAAVLDDEMRRPYQPSTLDRMEAGVVFARFTGGCRLYEFDIEALQDQSALPLYDLERRAYRTRADEMRQFELYLEPLIARVSAAQERLSLISLGLVPATVEQLEGRSATAQCGRATDGGKRARADFALDVVQKSLTRPEIGELRDLYATPGGAFLSSEALQEQADARAAWTLRLLEWAHGRSWYYFAPSGGPFTLGWLIVVPLAILLGRRIRAVRASGRWPFVVATIGRCMLPGIPLLLVRIARESIPGHAYETAADASTVTIALWLAPCLYALAWYPAVVRCGLEGRFSAGWWWPVLPPIAAWLAVSHAASHAASSLAQAKTSARTAVLLAGVLALAASFDLFWASRLPEPSGESEQKTPVAIAERPGRERPATAEAPTLETELINILTPGKGPTLIQDEYEFLLALHPDSAFNPKWDTRRVWNISYSDRGDVEEGKAIHLTGDAMSPADVAEFLKRLRVSRFVSLLYWKQTLAQEDPERGAWFTFDIFFVYSGY